MGLRLGGGLLLLGLSVGLVLVLEFEIWLGLKFWKVGHSSRRRKKKTLHLLLTLDDVVYLLHEFLINRRVCLTILLRILHLFF